MPTTCCTFHVDPAETKEKFVLGLDIGIASIGWSLVKFFESPFDDIQAEESERVKYKIADFSIVDLGVRSFAKSEDRQGNSLQKLRGEMRRVRTTLARRHKRRGMVRALLEESGLVSLSSSRKSFENKLFNKLPKHPSPWELRAKALDENLTPHELSRVLYHIIGHRGFYFTSKSQMGQSADSGKVKAGIKQLAEKKEGSRTIGEWLSTQTTQRNTKGSYQYCIKREWLKDELESILKKQRELGHSCIDQAFMKKAEDLLMHQKGYDASAIYKLWGTCPVYVQEKRAPRCSATAEYFSLLNVLNNLYFIDTDNQRLNPLTSEQRARVIEAVYLNKGCLTFTQLRHVLGAEAQGRRFNLCNYVSYVENETSRPCKKLRDATFMLSLYDANSGEERPLTHEEQNRLEKACQQQEKMPPQKQHLSFARIRDALSLGKNTLFSDLKYPPLQAINEKAFLNFYEKEKFVDLKGTSAFAGAFGERWKELYLCRTFLDDLSQILATEKEDAPRREGFSKIQSEHGIIVSAAEEDALLTCSFQGTATYGMKALRVLVSIMEGEKGLKHHEALEQAIREEQLPDFQHMSAEERKSYIPPYTGDFSNNPVICRVFAQCRKLINAINKKHGHCIDEIHIEVGTDIANGKVRSREISHGQAQFAAAKERAVCRLRELGMPINTANILKMRLYIEQEGRCVYTGAPIALENGTNHVHFDQCEVDHILPFSRTFNDSQNNKVLVTPAANQEKGNAIPREWLIGQRWDAFEQRVNSQMSRLPWNKKRNLLRMELTEQDREKFISRNLNDMRYASRAVADYLRKYFRFSSAREIKDVSRIQVVSGGITSMLRHAWGIEQYKNRELNDKHHAVDATVVACTNRGHVFFLANISQKYNKHVKFVFNDIFQHEHRLKHDIEAALPTIAVSRMVRHTVTGAAHEETIRPFDPEKIKAGRIATVNKGWAAMGGMVRADIFCDIVSPQGKNPKYYIVPIYPQDFLAAALPTKAIVNNAPYADWVDVGDPKKYKFCWSLFKDDLISIDGTYYYISFIQGTRQNIALAPFDHPSSPDEKISRKSINKGVIKKHAIDILGNITHIRCEKRQGTRTQVHARLRKA